MDDLDVSEAEEFSEEVTEATEVADQPEVADLGDLEAQMHDDYYEGSPLREPSPVGSLSPSAEDHQQEIQDQPDLQEPIQDPVQEPVQHIDPGLAVPVPGDADYVGHPGGPLSSRLLVDYSTHIAPVIWTETSSLAERIEHDPAYVIPPSSKVCVVF